MARRLIASILLLAGLLLAGVAPVKAQTIGCGNTIFGKAAAPPWLTTAAEAQTMSGPCGNSYSGPADIIGSSPLVWYGARALSSSTRGNHLLNVCNSTGGVDVGCADLSSDAATGKLKAATVSGITCPGANCTIKTWYDQGTLGLNVTQATIANRATLPSTYTTCIPLAGHGYSSATGVPSNILQPFSDSLVGERTANFTTGMTALDMDGGDDFAGSAWVNAANTFEIAADANLQIPANDSVLHASNGAFNTTSSFINIDGVATNGSVGAGQVNSGDTVYFGTDGFGGVMTGCLQEGGRWPIAFTPTQALLLCANQSSFWTTVSCGSAANVILDDDGATDIDDAADMRMFNNMAKAGMINPVGYIASDNDAFNVSTEKAFLTFQGLSTSLYAYQGNCCTEMLSGGPWTQDVTAQFNAGDSRTNYQDCEVGYRLLLSKNSSVTIILGGPATCIDLLLESPANYNGDGLGTGLSLIQNHVKQVIWAAGTWPSSTADFNLGINGTATADLFANWPSTVPFILYGVNLSVSATGPFPSGVCQTSATDPYQYGYFTFNSTANPCLRTFWTQPMFLYARFGLGNLFGVGGQNGTAAYNSGTTANTWTATAGPFTYLSNTATQAQLFPMVCFAEEITGTNWC